MDTLRNAQLCDIANLTEGRIVEYLRKQQNGGEAGVYAFYRKTDGAPVYVGRSANMIKRVGSQHSSTNVNLAAVTKALKDKPTLGLKTMGEARDILYRDSAVRFCNEPDVATRAILEIFASLSWDTEFNKFIEH